MAEGNFPNRDNIVGWGVVRDDPWHLAGIFEHRTQAQARADELGEGYVVRWGRGWVGSDDFVFEEPPHA